MIKKWASKKSFSIQSVAQQMKTMMRGRKIWVRAVGSQRVRMCSCQAACCSSQDRKCDDHSDKNRQNWSCSILEQDVSVWNRILCLSIQLDERDHSTCNRALSLFHWSKTSNSRPVHRSSEHQRSHQQFRRDLQADQMIHSAADSAAVQFDWETAVWRWRKWVKIVNNLMYRFKNRREVWKNFLQTISCCFLLYSKISMSSEDLNQEK